MIKAKTANHTARQVSGHQKVLSRCVTGTTSDHTMPQEPTASHPVVPLDFGKMGRLTSPESRPSPMPELLLLLPIERARGSRSSLSLLSLLS